MLAFNHLGSLGRLGNQMFEYAALRGIAAYHGYEWCIPPSDRKGIENYSLHECFNLAPQINDNTHAVGNILQCDIKTIFHY